MGPTSEEVRKSAHERTTCVLGRASSAPGRDSGLHLPLTSVYPYLDLEEKIESNKAYVLYLTSSLVDFRTEQL